MPVLTIIGAGSMGSNHVRTARTVREWRDVVVVDLDRERACTVGTANGFGWTTSVEEGLAKADAAVVAVPSELHEDVMRQIIERGLPVLLEKPVAVDFAAAERIRRSAAEQGVQVLVGHIERFNSAVEELMRHADSAVHIECRREGAGAGRPVGDVVSDLMVHDLDIVRALARSREGSDATINTRAAMWGNGGTEHCTALLQTDAGMTVTLVASRIGQFKRREIVLTQPGCQVIADLVRQSVTIHRLQRTEFVANGRGSFRQQGTTEIPYLDSGEPLVREHHHLVDVVTNGERPIVSLDDGLAAIRLVEQVRRAAEPLHPMGQPISRISADIEPPGGSLKFGKDEPATLGSL
jgi:UDP-N-acetylglucosamine 3-dehydrogenase